MRTLRIAAVLLALAAAAPLAAQDAAPVQDAAAPSAVDASTGAPAAVAAPAAASAAPFRYAAPPRTLRAYWHLFIAFAVAWVLLFGYVIVLARRFRRLEEQLGGA